ncbi:TniQ family protein [Roseiarcus sp.]|uniref:TniQ family protein n=1 Tax=Roseiarcus sp. TaxID=1969460 RepID=UPI003C56A87E
MTGSRRWPIHPSPLEGEALLSWLGRIAKNYGFTANELLKHDLGYVASGDENLDVAAPGGLLSVLASKTGQPMERLSRMTIGGCASEILGMAPVRIPLSPLRSKRCRQTFVEATCAEIGLFDRIHACRECANAAQTAWVRLIWRIPWVVSCPEHGLLLERASISPGSFVFWESPGPSSASEAVCGLDRLSIAAFEYPTEREIREVPPHEGWFSGLRRSLAQSRAALQANLETASAIDADTGLLRLAAAPYELLSRRDQVRMLEFVVEGDVTVQSGSKQGAAAFAR